MGLWDEGKFRRWKQWCLNEGGLHFSSISVVGIYSIRDQWEVTGCQGVITLSLTRSPWNTWFEEPGVTVPDFDLSFAPK